MHDIKNKINKAINDNKDEIIAFVQGSQNPSLANHESGVQQIIHNKLNSIGLSSKLFLLFLVNLNTILHLTMMVSRFTNQCYRSMEREK